MPTPAISQMAFQFSLQLCKVARANGDGTYGTAVTLPSARTLNLTIKFIKDRAEGNSIYTALAAQIIAVGWSVDGANLDQNVLATVFGETPAVSGTGLTEIDTINFANELMPYFGLVAQAWGQHGDDMCFLIPYTKVMDDTSWKLDFGKFASPSFKGEAINEPTFLNMLSMKNHATKIAGTALLFPPSWA